VQAQPESTAAGLGHEPPLVADGRAGPPDKREISARWLSGTFLTGVTSSVLMGVSLFAALDGRQQIATPPEVATVAASRDTGAGGEAAKSARILPPRTLPRARNKRRMEVSTMIRDGDREVIRTVPFIQVSMALAADHGTTRDYPPFNPLQVFADNPDAARPAPTGVIYGAKVETGISLRTSEFPLDGAAYDEHSKLSEDEIENVVRTTAAVLTDGDIQVAALHYVDPLRFGQTELTPGAIAASYGARVVPENMSVSPRDMDRSRVAEYAEDIIPFNANQNVADALAEHGYEGEDAAGMVEAITKLLNAPALKAGTVVRLGLEIRDERARVMRASIYNDARHLMTVCLNDRGQYVPAEEPELNPEVLTAFDDSAPVRVRGELPRVYDGIYRAAYSYGMSSGMTRELVKLLASDVDFQTRLDPADRLTVFFSRPDDNDKATDESELLYVQSQFGGATRTFYRFQSADGSIDYYDGEGRSTRQFLLRNPVPTGRFTSSFGLRRHPILGYSRMHTGVDWAAPVGTPILASGNGVVEKAGWSSGYGRQTIIRHNNGYESSYNHQSAFAKGVEPGARIRQGQVIGYVGASGLATGAHLHYELIVNGTKVDPMRVKLPVEKGLKGDDLQAFQHEKERIDKLLNQEGDAALKVASANR
jgi:murein DD-endopeptidase MepM/ murein hydrolase activator NlpD